MDLENLKKHPKAYFSTNLGVLLCGDCLEIMKELDDKSVDLVFTDPPYNFTSDGGGLFKKRGNLQRINSAFGLDFKPEELLNTIEIKLKTMHGYFWCSKAIVRNYLNWAQDREYGFNILAWHKSNPMPANNNNFLPDTEYCVFIRGKGTTFNQDAEMGLYKKYDITAIEPNNGHPTPKPLRLILKYLRISTKPEQLVLDPYFGSGTTGVGCEQLGRRWIGIEINEQFAELAARRIDNEARQGKMFV